MFIYILVQSTAIRTVHSSHGVHSDSQEGKINGHTQHKHIRIHQDLDDWLVRARSHQVCLQHTQELVKLCQNLGWLVNLEKSELEPKQVLDFVGYQFDLRSGWVGPTPHRWQTLLQKVQDRLHRPACLVQSGS